MSGYQRRALWLGGGVVAGLMAGLIISGRLSATQPPATAVVESPPIQGRAASASATSGTLPDLSDVAERAILASVNISSTQLLRVDPWFQMFNGGSAVRSQTSLGSGVIVSPDGYILTNSHVVGNAAAAIRVTLPDNRELPATLVGNDETDDLAVVKVAAQGLQPLPWGDSSRLRVAQWVLAIGNPFAFSRTVTLGIVSAVNRNDPQLSSYSDMIQTDAAINPGNSGGALIDARGELVGINTMIISETGGYQGLGFAIPATLAQHVMQLLIKDGEVTHGSIGLGTLRTVDPDRAEAAGYGRIQGVLVYDMYRGSAYDAGVRPEDIIVSYDGHAVSDEGQLQRLIADSAVGRTVKVEAIRGRQHLTLDVQVRKATPMRSR